MLDAAVGQANPNVATKDGVTPLHLAALADLAAAKLLVAKVGSGCFASLVEANGPRAYKIPLFIPPDIPSVDTHSHPPNRCLC